MSSSPAWRIQLHFNVPAERCSGKRVCHKLLLPVLSQAVQSPGLKLHRSKRGVTITRRRFWLLSLSCNFSVPKYCRTVRQIQNQTASLCFLACKTAPSSRTSSLFRQLLYMTIFGVEFSTFDASIFDTVTRTVHSWRRTVARERTARDGTWVPLCHCRV